MNANGATLYFTYDTNGTPLTISVDSEVYYYTTNLQGDVIGIVAADGTTKATYTYDAWGKILTASGSGIVGYNPLLYRGYVYDWGTELYYLQSRYYDPEVGRFINGDDVAYLGIGGLTSYNLFAYCENNPINYIDRTGENTATLDLLATQDLWATLKSWASGMWWLILIDAQYPIGDALYIGGSLILLGVVLFSFEDSTKAGFNEITITPNVPSPNQQDNDDDDTDDYYDDEDNFGGRTKIGKHNGNAPGNNKAQNKQFRDATKGLTPDQQRIVHNKITGKGLGYHEIKAVIGELFGVTFVIFAFEE